MLGADVHGSPGARTTLRWADAGQARSILLPQLRRLLFREGKYTVRILQQGEQMLRVLRDTWLESARSSRTGSFQSEQVSAGSGIERVLPSTPRLPDQLVGMLPSARRGTLGSEKDC